MIIVDAGTSYKYGIYLGDKSHPTTIESFYTFCIHAETITGRKVCRLHTDQAFNSNAWREYKYCKTHGIIHKFTAPYSSVQNELAERAIRTTMNDVQTLLCDCYNFLPYFPSYFTFTFHLFLF
jgi:hypothetical protein